MMHTSRIFSLVCLLVEVFLVWVAHVSILMSRRAYDLVIPCEILPRATILSMHSTWGFATVGLVLLLYIVLQWKHASISISVLLFIMLVNIALLVFILWGVLLPFALMTG